MTWAEQIEEASQADQRNMGFGPFFVHDGRLSTILDLVRTHSPGEKPEPWPIAPAPGWLAHRADGNGSVALWCALDGGFAFTKPVSNQHHVLHVPPALDDNRRARLSTMLRPPWKAIAEGQAFAFSNSMFVLPDEPFCMNSFSYHVPDRERLDVFVGYRGHPQQYPEILTPSVYRQRRHPTEESSRRYRHRARIASNIVKQAVFEKLNIVLSTVQAKGVLQHYDIIGPTDVLDLTYDVNVAKWFALNTRNMACGCYRPKEFKQHQDRAKGYEECSLVYTVVVRAISTLVGPDLAKDLRKFGHLTLRALEVRELEDGLVALPPRNLSPLWSTRAKRQSGFGLTGVGPNDDDAWGSVLLVYEHAFHPTFSPHGWDRIGGDTLKLAGGTYRWNQDTSALSNYILPANDTCIQWIRGAFDELQKRGKYGI